MEGDSDSACAPQAEFISSIPVLSSSSLKISTTAGKVLKNNLYLAKLETVKSKLYQKGVYDPNSSIKRVLITQLLPYIWV